MHDKTYVNRIRNRILVANDRDEASSTALLLSRGGVECRRDEGKAVDGGDGCRYVEPFTHSALGFTGNSW